MKKVYLKGPFLTQSGYGHHARTVYRALRSRPDLFDVYVQPITWGQTSWIWEDTAERKEFDSLLEKTIQYVNFGGQFDMSVQITIPNEWEKLAPINIGVTAGIESDTISLKWIEKSYVVDKIITISKHSKDGLVNTVLDVVNNTNGQKQKVSCETPVEYVTYPVRKFEPSDIELNLTTDFNFLAVAQISPRKNLEQLLSCFVEEFKDNENVGLVVKANLAKNSLIDRVNTLQAFQRIMSKFEDRKCKIYLLHGFLSDEDMAALYTHPKIKAFVSTTHGEGFGLPIFEAAYYGLPIAATNWSGHLDFLCKPIKTKGKGKEKLKPLFKRISYTLEQVPKELAWEGVLEEYSKWANPETGSVKMALEEIYRDYPRFKKQAKVLEEWVCEEFNAKKQYEQIVDLIKPEDDSDWLDQIEDLVKEYE